MAELSFSINQDDGLNVWIKQTLQDELTGAEFSKLENVLKNEHLQDIVVSYSPDKISDLLPSTSLRPIGGLITDKEAEIIEIESKARNILIEKAGELDASALREIFGENEASDKQNSAITIMKFFLAGKDFRAIKEWLDNSTNEIENELLEKITATLKKGLEICPILAVVGAHNVAFRE